ncbi:MAG: hydroxymethylglutaryl-CoA lyase [Elusimicrobia bacterium CG_4_10_14_0_2_um_filter_56_8]|nr:MAG: hypothetical protein AUJ51_11175 [Elusimicrobia bacterium CG1_02_56_21]PJA13456.1 MAG: hydroxymethylglutaryl-CoA lyase [Elusimicrobia bacterium CG_4_10_14_0_2_um_filter_56_8]
MPLNKDIILQEVGIRDGIQGEPAIVPTEKKIKWAEELLCSGIDIIQLGSFVRAEKVPQMADTEILFRHFSGAAGKPGAAKFSGLVLNEKGLERGLKCGVEIFCMGSSASETHSRENTGMGADEAAGRIAAMAKEALSAGKTVQASVQSAFGCGYEGPVPAEKVLAIVKTYLEAGVLNVGLSDTAGHAHPLQVREMFAAVAKLEPKAELSCHFHNAYALGLANCCFALEAGVRYFETSLGGLGGCPFIKLPSGNVCTEDFVHTVQRIGLREDINLEALIAVARDAEAFFGRTLPGAVMKHGSIVGFKGKK